MTIPSPYLDSNKELAPLSKGVPPIRTFLSREWVTFTIYVDGRVVFISKSYPSDRVPLHHVYVRAKINSRVRASLTLEKWHRGFPDFYHSRVPLPTYPMKKSQRMKVTIPPNDEAIRNAMRNARRRATPPHYGRRQSDFGSRKPSNLRPSPEIRTQPYNAIVEGNNGGYFLSSTPGSYTRYTRVWSGSRTPGFGKIKKTNLPVNAHSVRITEITDGPGIYQNLVGSIYFNRFNLFTLNYNAPPDVAVHMNDAQFKALRKLIEKAQTGIEANLAQDFAQIGQTVKLIGNTTKRLTQAIMAVKSGNFPKAVQSLWSGHQPRYNGKGPSFSKNLANNWLELQYGWKPLLQDIHGSMNSLAKLQVASPYVQRVAASATVDKLEKSPIAFRLDSSLKAGDQSIYTRSRCRYMIRYKIDDHLKSFLAQTGFTNPINLGWEILPFSFVVDWFVPIGPFLETLSSWDGLTFLDGCQTLFTRETVTSAVNFSGATPNAPGQLFEERARYNRQTTILSRSRLTAFPSALMPSGFKNGLASITHAQNALALLRSAFR